MSNYVEFDLARARQMLAEGRSILTRARMLDGVDADEVLERIGSLREEELADVEVLRESASLCFAASQASPTRQRPTENSLQDWAGSAMWKVSTAERPFFRDPLLPGASESWESYTEAVGGSAPVARAQGRHLLEVCSVVAPDPGCAELWAGPREETLGQVGEVADEGLTASPQEPEVEELEDLLARALTPGDMSNRSFPGPAFAQLATLGQLDRRIYEGESCVPQAIEDAARVIDGGGFAGGALVDLIALREAMQAEVTTFAPSVTRAVRTELGGEAREDNGRHWLGSAMRVTLVWLWSARHASRTTE